MSYLQDEDVGDPLVVAVGDVARLAVLVEVPAIDPVALLIPEVLATSHASATPQRISSTNNTARLTILSM